jgi:hypothetical protein
MIRAQPFIANVVARPWHFYLSNIAAINPLYLFAIVPLLHPKARELALGTWVVAYLAALMVFGLVGGGYQSRHLAPAYPALAILAASLMPRWRLRPASMIGLAALVGYGMMNALVYAVLETPRVADFEFSAARAFVQVLRTPESGK